MQAQHPSSSIRKATIPPKPDSQIFKHPRPLIATAIIGAALIGYIVHKTEDSRQKLQSLAEIAQTLGELSERDAAVVALLLAKPIIAGANQ